MKEILTIAIIAVLFLSMFTVLPLKATAQQSSSAPTGIVYSVPITLTNTQSMATASPFQQMITVNSAAYSSYETSNLQNIEFYDNNGMVIPSWLESGNSNTATDTIYWLKLPSIPANSQTTICMGFASLGANLFNTQTTGEAPDLSPSYGEYDDGASVFAYYWSFPGPNLPSGWAFSDAVPTQGGCSVNAGASFFTGSGESNEVYGYYTAPLEAGSYLISTRMESYAGGNNGEGVWFGWWSDPQSPLANGNAFSNYVSAWIWCPFFNPVQPLRVTSNGGITPAALSGGGYPPGSTLFDATQYMTYRLSWLGSNQTAMLRTDAGGVGVASQIASSPPQGSYYLGFYAPTAGEGNNGETAQWVAVSAMPPSGIMPSVSFGSSTGATSVTSSPKITALGTPFNLPMEYSGKPVEITGSGWTPGSTVAITFEPQPTCGLTVRYNLGTGSEAVLVDSNGNFLYNVPSFPSKIGVTPIPGNIVAEE